MISNTGECEMQLFKYASLLVTTFLLSISSVSAQDLYRTIDVIPLSENCDWAVAPDSTGVVFSTTDGGVADYLVGITTDAGFSSAVVSVCNADSIMQQSGDSGLALALPVALRRNNEIAFAMEVKLDPFADPPPGGNRSSYSSGSWLDDYSDWFNGTFGSGWSEAVGGCLHLVDFGFMPAVVGGSLRTSFSIVGFGGWNPLGVNTGVLSLIRTIEEAKKFFTLAENTEHMEPVRRTYVVGGTIIADVTGVRGISDACSPHDAIDGHEQSVGERVMDGTLGTAQLAGTVWGISRGIGVATGTRVATSGPIDVTEDAIRQAMKDAPLSSQQAGGISRPMVERYVRRLEAGEVPPRINVDGDIIVEGNHRYVAGRLYGEEPPIQPWVGGKPDRVIPWEDLPISPKDWDK
ncbi:hypothetical protein N9B88_01185 [Rubripirellula sp.]|nr:hypothetical protein [Rubripirellula sp.]